jgi:2'-5' RNA ligase
MHEALYTGVLEAYRPEWSRGFVPHMTVGRLEDAAEFEAAANATRRFCEEFSTVVRRVSCEIIAENSDSIIEFEVELDAE